MLPFQFVSDDSADNSAVLTTSCDPPEQFAFVASLHDGVKNDDFPELG
jgi:hypothetical protein